MEEDFREDPTQYQMYQHLLNELGLPLSLPAGAMNTEQVLPRLQALVESNEQYAKLLEVFEEELARVAASENLELVEDAKAAS